MRAGAQCGQLGVRVAQDVGDPVAVGVERRPQAPGGLDGRERDREVGRAAAAVAHPLHLAAVGVEGDRAAHAVEQGVRVAVGEVGPRHAVVVVLDPRDRRVVGPERSAGQQQAEAGALERRQRAAPPGRELAHVVRLVGDHERLGGAAAVQARAGCERRVRDRDAVAIARLGAGGVGAVGLEVDAVARGVERPLAADVRGGCDHGDARDAALGEHPVRDVRGRRRLAGRRRGRRQECVSLVRSGTAAAAASCQARRGRPAGHARQRATAPVGGMGDRRRQGRRRLGGGEDGISCGW